MASVFWDAKGIIFTDYLEKGRAINSEYYIQLLVKLKEQIALKRPGMYKNKFFSPGQCYSASVDGYNGQTVRIELRIASSPTIISGPGP